MLTTRIGVIGCGYVFDHYMSTLSRHPGLNIAGIADIDPVRLAQVAAFYRLTPKTTADLLADPTITIIVNLTSIEAHYDVTRAALLAGKHVYSEKPLVTDLDQARALFALAAERGLHLSTAPCNDLSPSVQTLWKALSEGAIGTPRLVYAEFDDNPVPLMEPEHWRSRSGAPWPWLHEYQAGCTWEHAGYHLVSLCTLFGPVARVTAYSTRLDAAKAPQVMTPDFSVACLEFASGVTARLTCSIAAPLDHSMRVIGSAGMLSTDTYRHYNCPVRLERFSALGLNARKARTVRNSTLLQRLFGLTGRKLPLIAPFRAAMSLNPKVWLRRFKQAQLGQQDKCLGLADLARAIATGGQPFHRPDFILHVTELTLAIQAAGPEGASQAMTTSFAPQAMPEATRAAQVAPKPQPG